jgi:hypothetical protein
MQSGFDGEQLTTVMTRFPSPVVLCVNRPASCFSRKRIVRPAARPRSSDGRQGNETVALNLEYSIIHRSNPWSTNKNVIVGCEEIIRSILGEKGNDPYYAHKEELHGRRPLLLQGHYTSAYVRFPIRDKFLL